MIFTSGTKAKASDANKLFGLYTGFEQVSLAVTNSNNSVSPSAKYSYYLIHNDGAVTAYVNFDTTATTDSFDLLAGEKIVVYGTCSAIHGITSSGNTTLRIFCAGTTTDANNLSVQKLAVTDSNSSLTLTSNVTQVLVTRNVGTKSSYININGAATTSHMKITPNSINTLLLKDMVTLQSICDTSNSTTLKVIGASGF